MPSRDSLVQEFLTSLMEAFRVSALGPEATAAIERIFGALQTPGPVGAVAGNQLPVCR